MFCDLVGSTPLAARLDPEDMREVIAAYYSQAAALIRDAGGFVAKYVGDGVLAYFGYPQAHEEDAECAVRAGLAIAQAVARLATPAGPPGALQARVGIASGRVVVGNVSDAGTGEAHSVVGDTPNLAARLQALARPGSVVIDPGTRRQVGRLFAYDDLGPQALKGIADPVRVWQVQGERQGRSRFDALRAEDLTPLVGREEELDLLLRRWREARGGEGRVVLVAGEPGIGKSRLIAAFEAQLKGEAYIDMRCFCAPHRQDSSFYPIIARLEHAAGFTREDAPDEKRRKLRDLLARTATSPEGVAVFADLLSIPADPGQPAPESSPQRRKERIFEACIREVEATARRTPAVLLIEDAHWLDPSSRELLDLVVERLADMPVLLLITYRPEFQPPWLGRAGVSLLALSRLDRQRAAEIAVQVAARSSLAGGMLARIVSAADGVPLFVEELTKAVLESGATGARVSVPSTLQASLMARLDRLPAAKKVAQVGAVIGRSFPHRLVAAVARLPEATLRQGCEDLVAAGLASRHGDSPETIYTFKHALVQDTAYESLLRTHRAALHARVADALLEQDPDISNTQPELLGYHCAEAKRTERATAYFLEAGTRSAGRSAMAEAKAHLAHGLALAAELPDGPARRLRQTELQLALGNVEMAIHGSGSPEHGAAVALAAELCRVLSPTDPSHVRLAVRALYGDCSYKIHRGDLDAALSVADRLLRVGRDQDDPGVRLFTAQTYGQSRFLVGRFADVVEAFADAASSDGDGIVPETDTSGDFGTDAVVTFRIQFSRALACMGFPDQAKRQAELGLNRARQLGHLPSFAIALSVVSTAAWIIRDVPMLRTTSNALVTLSAEQGFSFWLMRGKSYAGWLAAQDGDAARGQALIKEALSGLRAAGLGVYAPHTSAMLADARAQDDRGRAAMGAVDAGLRIMARTGETWIGADLHRRKGELLLARGGQRDAAAAEDSFHQAINIARNQSAKLFELRATTSLARLRLDAGKRAEAGDLLAPICGWFTEGFDAPDLREARVVLEAAG